jgi:2-hydroxychromene-2-carboxylate isomerase
VGELISLTQRIAERAREVAATADGRAAFLFALDCPVSYLVAEQVERDLGEIAWVPALAPATEPARLRERMRIAKYEAVAYRLPLVEPDGFPADPLPAARAAIYASGVGRGAGFAVAAMRMAFAGGFDISDPDILAEAAAAAGISVDATLAAAQDGGHDAALAATAAVLARHGIREPPVIRLHSGWFSGFEALARTSAFTAARDSHHALSAEPA